MLLVSRLTQEGMSLTDIVFHRGLFVLILIEFFADQQQWRKHFFPLHFWFSRYSFSQCSTDFQQAKREYQRTAKLPSNSKYTAEDLDRGFVVSGLWAWSRHPNFAAEQAIWFLLYQWVCYDSLTYFNWTFAGAGCYLALFQSSTWFTESLSSQKYPEYSEYQKLVGMFVPMPLLLFGGSRGSSASVAKKGDGKTKKKVVTKKT
jgi:steroid 5-alpha reductase family enzyme